MMPMNHRLLVPRAAPAEEEEELVAPTLASSSDTSGVGGFVIFSWEGGSGAARWEFQVDGVVEDEGVGDGTGSVFQFNDAGGFLCKVVVYDAEENFLESNTKLITVS